MTQHAEAPPTVPAPQPPVALPDTGDPTANIPIPEAPTPPPVEAPPTESAKEPESPQESAIARALRRREATLVAQQQEFRRRTEAEERGRAGLVAAEVQRQVAEQLRALDEDPIGFLEKRGQTKQKLADRLLNEGKKSADQIAQEARDRAEALERRLAERDALDRRQRAESEYKQNLRANEAKYPHLLDEWTEEEIIDRTYAVLQRLDAKFRAEGRARPDITDEEILQYLDGQAKKRQSARDERKQARSARVDTKAAPQGATKADAKTDSATKDATAGATATTLSSRMAAERQTMGAKDMLEIELEKGPDEAREYLLREIEKARSGAQSNGAR